MHRLRIAVIGGGPAGLTAARLLKGRHPTWDVTVYEHLATDRTFGFGVALHPHLLTRLRAADPAMAAGLAARGHPLLTWTISRPGDRVSVANDHGVGISRVELLTVLEREALRVGARIERGRTVAIDDVTADVVVAADGVGSRARRQLGDALGVTAEQGELAYVWCGAEVSTEGMLLSLARLDQGVLAAHVMPYGGGRCTFQVDAHVDTVAALGLDERTPDLLEHVFADVLHGARLVAQRPRWARFTTVRCERWWDRKVVLIGDAAHTAHYTVGSGTRLAMEDAAVLADALDGAATIADAFAGYEAARRPTVERLQWRAALSERWWASIDHRFDLPGPRLLVGYLTRTGAVTLPRLGSSDAELVARCLHLLGGRERTRGHGDLAGRVLRQPFAHAGQVVPGRVVDHEGTATGTHEVVTLDIDGVRAWSPAAQPLVDEARRVVTGTGALVRLAGPADRPALLERLDVAEQLRLVAGASTIVQGPGSARDDLALGVLAGRTDLVEIETEAQVA